MGRLFSAYMSTSGDLGLVTAEQNAILLAVFSEPVTGLSTQSFQVTGPPSSTIQALKPVAGTLTYYHVVIALPGDYYGNVTVSLTVSPSVFLSRPDASWVCQADISSQML